MAIFNRPITKRQLRHTASRSRSHAIDKAQGEARQQTTFISVMTPKGLTPKRSFTGLPGSEWIREGGEWKRCDHPEEYADYVERLAASLNFYQSQTRRKETKVMMRRQVSTPVEIPIISFAPWVSDFIAAAIHTGRDTRPLLARILNSWIGAIEPLLRGKRHLLGMALHTDCDDLHIDLLMSRQDGVGGRIGTAGLRLVGPWCVGVDRQLRSGAKISPLKQDRFAKSVSNFNRRYGTGNVPLDVAFARSLDAAAEQVIGVDLVPFKESYAQRVPDLELGHVEAQLAALEAAKMKVLQGAPLAVVHSHHPGSNLSR